MPRKQKQKQKQSQRQSVVVNIHEKKEKKRRPHRKKREESLPLPPPVVLGLPKVPPIVVQYSEPASLQAPPPVQQPIAQPAIATSQVAPRFEEPVRGAFAESRPKTPAKSIIEQYKEQRLASILAKQIKKEPRFETPPRAEEIQTRIPPSFQDITQQPPREETLAESLPAQVASGGGSAVRRPRATPTFVYPRREIVIREIVRTSGKFNAAELKVMDTKDLRDIYDSLGLYRK